jgi:hypothetical protein
MTVTKREARELLRLLRRTLEMITNGNDRTEATEAVRRMD